VVVDSESDVVVPVVLGGLHRLGEAVLVLLGRLLNVLVQQRVARIARILVKIHQILRVLVLIQINLGVRGHLPGEGVETVNFFGGKFLSGFEVES